MCSRLATRPASVRRHFVDRLTSEELGVLGRIAQKLGADR